MRISPIDISGSGLRAQRLRMELIANNIANIDTTSDEVVQGEYVRHIPYRRKIPIFKPYQTIEGKKAMGVSVAQVLDDMTDFRYVYDPGHPHSIKDPTAKDFGYVYYPNVNPVVEFVDMIEATRAYEANVSAIESFKAMAQASLRILA